MFTAGYTHGIVITFPHTMPEAVERLPWIFRGTNYLRYALNKLTGRETVMPVDLAGQSVSLNISSSREIRRAHALHHERSFIERICQHLTDKDVVYDIGANIGVLSLLMARHVNTAHVQLFSFEPEPRNYEKLVRNISLNKLQSSIDPQQLALGTEQGTVELHVRGTVGEGRHSIAESKGATDSISVQLSTCELFARQADAYPDLLKIDVEGAEGQVLAGLAGLLDTHPPRDIFLEVHSKGDSDNMPDGTKINDWFIKNNYDLVWQIERRSGEHRHYRHKSLPLSNPSGKISAESRAVTEASA